MPNKPYPEHIGELSIVEITIRALNGVIHTSGPFWEERQMRPVDFYPAFHAQPPMEGGTQQGDNEFHVLQLFLEITTDKGQSGLAGPIWPGPARIILDEIAPLLKGRDPLATEYLWDLMHRSQPHGRQGHAMLAISAIDCALWDLKGKILAQPVWRLLGGKTRDAVPAYAAMLGFAVDDFGLVRKRALAFKKAGYTGQKWFFRHTPAEGAEGMTKNIELVRTVRDAVGDGYDIMFDCWQSLTYEYALELCQRIEEFRPRWIEEPFMPDRIDVHAKLREKTRIPLSGAEHDYARWGMMRFIEKNALDIYQPDIYWCGGISETLKIAALASTYDLTLIPHGHSTPAGIHFSAAQPPNQVPLIEYLVKWNEINMHFLKDAPWPENGSVTVPDRPGLGMELDPDKIESEAEFSL